MSESINIITDQIVVFTLDEQLYGLPLQAVDKVIHVVEIRHLPKTPEIITGIINIKGKIIPVVDIRKRLELATHEIDPDDRLIITDTGKRTVAILVDTVTGIRDLKPGQQAKTKEAMPYAKFIKGVAKTDEGLILIYDLEQFLSLDEEKELEQALKTKNK